MNAVSRIEGGGCGGLQGVIIIIELLEEASTMLEAAENFFTPLASATMTFFITENARWKHISGGVLCSHQKYNAKTTGSKSGEWHGSVQHELRSPSGGSRQPLPTLGVGSLQSSAPLTHKSFPTSLNPLGLS